MSSPSSGNTLGIAVPAQAVFPQVRAMESFPTDPVLAQQQADSLNGNALRSLEQFKNTLVHAVWYFARFKNAFG